MSALGYQSEGETDSTTKKYVGGEHWFSYESTRDMINNLNDEHSSYISAIQEST
jgi:hypothetical protein